MLGERIMILREKADQSRAELAAELNLTERAISYYENNKRRPSYETLQDIANYFDVSTDYLLGRSDYRNQPKVQAAHIAEGDVVTQDVLDQIEVILKKAREDMKKG